MAKSGLVPGREELNSIAHAALMHAQTQLASVEVLLDNGHWPAAHAMATLTFEEIGKAVFCLIGAATPERLRVKDWFWPVFNHHASKITIARFMLALTTAAGTPPQPVVQAIEEMGELAAADHATKMRGLYVDFNNGDLLDPADVDEQAARSMAGNVRICLEFLGQLTSDAQLAAEFGAFMTDMSTALDTLIDSPDIDGESFLQTLWDAAHADGPPRPPWELFPGIIPAPDNDG